MRGLAFSTTRVQVNCRRLLTQPAFAITTPRQKTVRFVQLVRFFYTPNMAARDPSTASNYDAWKTKHTTANLRIDFDDKCLRGSVVLELESRTAKESKEIVLDSSYVSVESIKLNDVQTKWEIKERNGPMGSPLHISVPEGADSGEVVRLEMAVKTTPQCTALQWLTPAQTSNKKAPFMFSQAQACHARSLFPCQDTPDVKSTYSFNITSPHVVVASGVANDGDKAEADGGDKVYKYEQNVPIPSYLFALASGDIAMAPIGPRSSVATGPDEVKECQWELEEDMGKFMDAAERLVFPYKWGEYNVLVLPPSFPYGGMENPIYTFATPTIISGDRQNTDVIAHELSHSWSGNLVTSCSWEHYWLNEGWTMYLERRIIAAVRGPAYFDFSALLGWKHLEDAIEEFGADHKFTQLCINHKGIDPDDAFSTVPYEKGFHMVYYLDRLVGRKNFDKFIPYYFTKWANKSLDSYEFKDTFLEFFDKPEYADLKDKIAGIDWEGRFYTPGLPPKPEFDTSLVDVCYALADKWKKGDYTPSSKDVDGWTGNQKLVFLGSVQDFEQPLSAEQAKQLGNAYDLIETKNVELKTAYYLIALRAQDSTAYQGVADLLGQVGRMKFVRPLFRALNKVDRPLALTTFEKNKDFYHPICRAMAEKDLGLSDDAKKE
ncbi:leukotriene A-4 hydrolase [Pyricularia oryzae 70-15]|nr:leukotriene A-4 hydrolase [Pyricularia oryzae 70-15]EHA52461.1 leukotriene A-4 hydrolase [Pyricularia oryzae 70-15]KAI7916464.1 leukotriene A-4 hydrolase [Pyricularia oryzae]KAI7917555.1 leukotriene A-4 hydrolase [Pyricularia oryzae]